MEDYMEGVDPALLGIRDFIKLFSDVHQQAAGLTPDVMEIESMRLNLPLDLQIGTRPDGSIIYGGNTPATIAPISVQPVFHRIILTITATNQPEDGSI